MTGGAPGGPALGRPRAKAQKRARTRLRAVDPGPSATGLYRWRKLSAAKWEDAWMDRLAGFTGRLAITALAGAKSIRLEIFQLRRAEADELLRTFAGEIREQKRVTPMPEAVPRPPIRVRDKLFIISNEGERRNLPAGRKERKIVLIPAGMAFGTGEHATTAACLRLLADLSGPLAGEPWEMLDLGTGSGILAIAARILGARRVEAADFDPHAVRIAKENARVNGVGDLVIRRLDLLAWQPERTWDVVAANIYSGILVRIAPKLAASSARGGHLIFSGILREQEPEAIAALEQQKFRIARIERKGKWVSGLAWKR